VTLEILDPGGLATVQDVAGRRPWRRYGVPHGGAADPMSARLANRLVGNPDDAAVLELVLGGTVRVAIATTVAVTGGLAAAMDGIPMPPDAARRLPAGARIRIEPGSGLRGYLAVAGGIEVEPVLGSRATDLRTGFGGFAGRALQSGDRLAIGQPRPDALPRRWLGTRADGPLRIVAGPQAASASSEALTLTAWRVGQAVDRTGVRLEGRALEDGGEVPSQGLLPGAIQLPPDGAPILMLADCPVTGGYRVPACVIGADLGRVAQLPPGDQVALVEVSPLEAREAWLQLESNLAAIEPLDTTPDDEPGWAGSHG
jgi:biotin-dependent carboxylase-like uncharacterized protein